MLEWLKNLVKKLALATGYEIRKAGVQGLGDSSDNDTISAVRQYTQASPERLIAVIDATRYISNASIPGAVVECGVWRGGCMMAAAMTLLKIGDLRDLYLFDTFEGMSEPTAHDKYFRGDDAVSQFEQMRATGAGWNAIAIEEVRKAMRLTGYPEDRIHFIKGKVEDTLPSQAPASIALLRLDTDWYESTRHEMVHLYPRLVAKGVLIVDDYGAWAGSKKAVDEYIAENKLPILLNRTDFTGRMAVKV